MEHGKLGHEILTEKFQQFSQQIHADTLTLSISGFGYMLALLNVWTSLLKILTLKQG